MLHLQTVHHCYVSYPTQDYKSDWEFQDNSESVIRIIRHSLIEKGKKASRIPQLLRPLTSSYTGKLCQWQSGVVTLCMYLQSNAFTSSSKSDLLFQMAAFSSVMYGWNPTRNGIISKCFHQYIGELLLETNKLIFRDLMAVRTKQEVNYYNYWRKEHLHVRQLLF